MCGFRDFCEKTFKKSACTLRARCWTDDDCSDASRWRRDGLSTGISGGRKRIKYRGVTFFSTHQPSTNENRYRGVVRENEKYATTGESCSENPFSSYFHRRKRFVNTSRKTVLDDNRCVIIKQMNEQILFLRSPQSSSIVIVQVYKWFRQILIVAIRLCTISEI